MFLYKDGWKVDAGRHDDNPSNVPFGATITYGWKDSKGRWFNLMTLRDGSRLATKCMFLYAGVGDNSRTIVV